MAVPTAFLWLPRYAIAAPVAEEHTLKKRIMLVVLWRIFPLHFKLYSLEQVPAD
ncbi:MAG TPA: hypothetical protein VMR28_03245 [Candidatus Saccharimonadales bacterium]|nr:hypothetical protein [Candidatus Saccharimonadales bacterium]